jgi:gastric triacylglycerol lipase
MMVLKVISLMILASLSATKLHPEAKLYFPDYCTYFNYPSQMYYFKFCYCRHNVVTDDGYILTYFRIQAKNTEIKEGLPPILMQHGLLDCSDTFIINDEEHAIGFALANAGYDVWFGTNQLYLIYYLGNNRGNKHSLHH